MCGSAQGSAFCMYELFRGNFWGCYTLKTTPKTPQMRKSQPNYRFRKTAVTFEPVDGLSSNLKPEYFSPNRITMGASEVYNTKSKMAAAAILNLVKVL
jgi:hypothetical protein